jgi:hypothetical protein
MDGAEFYRDTEFNVWSMSSILSAGDVTMRSYPYVSICGFGIPSINVFQLSIGNLR